MAKLTVGDLRKAMEDLPDDAMAFVNGNPDRAIDSAFMSTRLIPFSNEDWQPGDATVTGLELWLEDDDEFPHPQCQHAFKSQEVTTKGERA